MRRIPLTAHDGFEFFAWHEAPREARRGGLVICHAVWGVTPHLKDLSHDLAGEGYEVLIPDLLARYDAKGGFPDKDTDPAVYPVREQAALATGWGGSCDRDVQAAIDYLRADGPVYLMGFCFGGTAGWVAACRCEGVTAAACFYGGHIVQYASETPRCPTILHFGKTDELIPQHDVDVLRELHPDMAIHEYDAGHAFVAQGWTSEGGYHADSARLAMLRTRAFFHKASGAKEAGT